MCEKTHALRLQFEYEKNLWTAKLRQDQLDEAMDRRQSQMPSFSRQSRGSDSPPKYSQRMEVSHIQDYMEISKEEDTQPTASEGPQHSQSSFMYDISDDHYIPTQNSDIETIKSEELEMGLKKRKFSTPSKSSTISEVSELKVVVTSADGLIEHVAEMRVDIASVADSSEVPAIDNIQYQGDDSFHTVTNDDTFESKITSETSMYEEIPAIVANMEIEQKPEQSYIEEQNSTGSNSLQVDLSKMFEDEDRGAITGDKLDLNMFLGAGSEDHTKIIEGEDQRSANKNRRDIPEPLTYPSLAGIVYDDFCPTSIAPEQEKVVNNGADWEKFSDWSTGVNNPDYESREDAGGMNSNYRYEGYGDSGTGREDGDSLEFCNNSSLRNIPNGNSQIDNSYYSTERTNNDGRKDYSFATRDADEQNQQFYSDDFMTSSDRDRDHLQDQDLSSAAAMAAIDARDSAHINREEYSNNDFITTTDRDRDDLQDQNHSSTAAMTVTVTAADEGDSAQITREEYSNHDFLTCTETGAPQDQDHSSATAVAMTVADVGDSAHINAEEYSNHDFMKSTDRDRDNLEDPDHSTVAVVVADVGDDVPINRKEYSNHDFITSSDTDNLHDHSSAVAIKSASSTFIVSACQEPQGGEAMLPDISAANILTIQTTEGEINSAVETQCSSPRIEDVDECKVIASQDSVAGHPSSQGPQTQSTPSEIINDVMNSMMAIVTSVEAASDESSTSFPSLIDFPVDIADATSSTASVDSASTSLSATSQGTSDIALTQRMLSTES